MFLVERIALYAETVLLMHLANSHHSIKLCQADNEGLALSEKALIALWHCHRALMSFFDCHRAPLAFCQLKVVAPQIRLCLSFDVDSDLVW